MQIIAFDAHFNVCHMSFYVSFRTFFCTCSMLLMLLSYMGRNKIHLNGRIEAISESKYLKG